MFRKVGAFVYVMSALVSMEGCLSVSRQEPTADERSPTVTPECWEALGLQNVLRLLQLIFNTLCVAMRYEPANAKFFQQEVCFFNSFSFHICL